MRSCGRGNHEAEPSSATTLQLQSDFRNLENLALLPACPTRGIRKQTGSHLHGALRRWIMGMKVQACCYDRTRVAENRRYCHNWNARRDQCGTEIMSESVKRVRSSGLSADTLKRSIQITLQAYAPRRREHRSNCLYPTGVLPSTCWTYAETRLAGIASTHGIAGSLRSTMARADLLQPPSSRAHVWTGRASCDTATELAVRLLSLRARDGNKLW
jgi:hypothetical protein